MQKKLFLTWIGVVFIMTCAFPVTAQSKLIGSRNTEGYPDITELENEFGALTLTDEFLVELEIAQMEQALQEEDSAGFAEGFSGEGEPGLESDPLQSIIEFMGYFIRIMQTRTIHSAPGEDINGTFDFTIRDANLHRQGNHINLSAIVEFSYLMINDSTQVPISAPVQAKFYLRNKRWKIKHVQGLFEFFYTCIERLSPNEPLPEKYRQLVADFRYPGTQTSIRGRKK